VCSGRQVSNNRSELARAREMVVRAVEDQSDFGQTPEVRARSCRVRLRLNMLACCQVDARLTTTYIGRFRYKERLPADKSPPQRA
jgi:hypothetical protein